MKSKLLFIYGPPAVGKYTVSKEVSILSEYKIYHNHLTADIASLFAEIRTPKWIDIVRKLRIQIFNEAISQNTNLIFTFCYEKGISDSFVKNVIKLYSIKNIYFVMLISPIEILLKRVESEERKQFKKLTNKEVALNAYTNNDYFSVIPGTKTLQINNSNLKPTETAKIIINYWGIDSSKNKSCKF